MFTNFIASWLTADFYQLRKDFDNSFSTWVNNYVKNNVCFMCYFWHNSAVRQTSADVPSSLGRPVSATPTERRNAAGFLQGRRHIHGRKPRWRVYIRGQHHAGDFHAKTVAQHYKGWGFTLYDILLPIYSAFRHSRHPRSLLQSAWQQRFRWSEAGVHWRYRRLPPDLSDRLLWRTFGRFRQRCLLLPLQPPTQQFVLGSMAGYVEAQRLMFSWHGQMVR